MASSTLKIKLGLLAGTLFLFFIWLTAGTLWGTLGRGLDGTETTTATVDNGYVGSETCAACHETQFNSVSATKHGRLHTLAAWKGKVVGCESCHGPGKDHAESGDPTKIISFKKMNAKAISETCLGCHAGKESHNNFRRGEHWRNNIGCTDCHVAHGPTLGPGKPESITLIADASKANQKDNAMLRSTEPKLCMSCHNETKSQFSKPFHHRVLEGTMNCSDCHNAHGGFEQKQTKLAVGVDAACIKCHSNKQGPFVFEHAPLKVEGCSACHTPHGSANPKMLKRSSVRQLCMECHSSITESAAPDTPSFHNQATVRYQNCTICHAAIHGSNTSGVFFR
jgi:predicted CXXCH cytochrome family protein